jgi:hypothetical protein
MYFIDQRKGKAPFCLALRPISAYSVNYPQVRQRTSSLSFPALLEVRQIIVVSVRRSAARRKYISIMGQRCGEARTSLQQVISLSINIVCPFCASSNSFLSCWFYGKVITPVNLICTETKIIREGITLLLHPLFHTGTSPLLLIVSVPLLALGRVELRVL